MIPKDRATSTRTNRNVERFKIRLSFLFAMDRRQVENLREIVKRIGGTKKDDQLTLDTLQKKLTDLLESPNQSGYGSKVDEFFMALVKKMAPSNDSELDTTIDELIRHSLHLRVGDTADQRPLVIDVQWEDTTKRPNTGPRTKTMTSDQARA